MTSIAYGIDGNGRKVYAEEAYSGRTYICPYCFEDLHVRKCYDRDDYFAHKTIHNRTPQQMLCPGYTGSGSIESEDDKIWIVNGGVPLQLTERANGKYELIAHFPLISKDSLDKLISWNSVIEITNDGAIERYSAMNFRKYRLKTANEWIKVRCINNQGYIDEVKKKWEWGIRGISFDNDLFNAEYRDGCRVAQHSNIIVGKEYLFVHRFGTISNLNGVEIELKGSLSFTNMAAQKSYDVYSMTVTEVTEEAIAFVQNKGYQLIEESDEIIPLWPPAVMEGKELIYSKNVNEAFFYHKKKSNQTIYSWEKNYTRPLYENEDIFKSSTQNKSLILSDYEFNLLSKEIRYILTQNRDNYRKDKVFMPQISWESESGIEIPFTESIPNELKKTELYLNSINDLKVLIVRNGVVENSFINKCGRLKQNRELFILDDPFNRYHFIQQNPVAGDKHVNDRYINEIANKLYHCRTEKVAIDDRIFYWIKMSENISEDLYKILTQWKNIGFMPKDTEKIMKDLEMRL